MDTTLVQDAVAKVVIRCVDIVNELIADSSVLGVSAGKISDGYHTFEELYEHRTLLLALLAPRDLYFWKSKAHNDGAMYPGYFIVGTQLRMSDTEILPITYHCQLKYWDLFKCAELPHAPQFDGHTPKDVIDRIVRFLLFSTSKPTTAR